MRIHWYTTMIIRRISRIVTTWTTTTYMTLTVQVYTLGLILVQLPLGYPPTDSSYCKGSVTHRGHRSGTTLGVHFIISTVTATFTLNSTAGIPQNSLTMKRNHALNPTIGG